MMCQDPERIGGTRVIQRGQNNVDSQAQEDINFLECQRRRAIEQLEVRKSSESRRDGCLSLLSSVLRMGGVRAVLEDGTCTRGAFRRANTNFRVACLRHTPPLIMLSD